jgi:hypothetical protein
VDHVLGQDGGGGGAVAGDVVGLDGRFLEQLGAHVLIRVLQLDLLGHGHAVVGDGGRAELLVEATLRPLGPRVVETAVATVSMPRFSLRRASSEKTSCFAVS